MPTNRKPGKPAYEPTPKIREQVMSMAACGIRRDQIARVMSISLPTLNRHFKAELELGSTRANLEIATSLFNQAKGGNLIAMFFWLKCRAGWKENALPDTGKLKSLVPKFLIEEWKKNCAVTIEGPLQLPPGSE